MAIVETQVFVHSQCMPCSYGTMHMLYVICKPVVMTQKNMHVLVDWTYPQYPRATETWSWWRSVLAMLIMVALFALLGFLAVKGVDVLVKSLAWNDWFDESWTQSFFFDMLLAHVALILLIPPCLLAARWGFRHDGLMWSVARRMRWGWFWRCMGVALVGMLVVVVLDLALGHAQAQWKPEPKAWALLLMALLLTPLQALAEELAFRGVLFQAIGSWFARPLVAVCVATAVTALLFALVHGPQQPAVFLDRLVMGVLLCWLAYKTQGLEASIALHIVNNQITFALATATGTLKNALLAVDVSQLEVAVHISCMVLVSVWLVRMYRRSSYCLFEEV